MGILWGEAPQRKSATKAGYEVSAQYLYRRSSGIYFVRLCVPARLKKAVGKGEIHRSTGCRDLRLAKIVAAEVAAHWHRALEAVQNMDPEKIKAGSIALLGSGFVGLVRAAGELGADPEELAQRLADRGAKFYIEAHGVAGWALDSIYLDAEYDRDEFGRLSMLMPPSNGVPTSFSGNLRVLHSDQAIEAAKGEARICSFIVWPTIQQGFVVDLPGHLVLAKNLLVDRSDVESLRQSLACHLAPVDRATAAVEQEAPGSLRFSEFAEEFLKRNKGLWKRDQFDRKTAHCAAFRELMGDPVLSNVTRPMMRRFSDELARVPDQRDKVRRRFGKPEAGFRELIELADIHGLPGLTVNARQRFLDGVSEVLEWGVRETYLAVNPAKGLGSEVERTAGPRKVKDHEQREAFSRADLTAIFGAEWFVEGAGTKTPKGVYHSYRPHYYWLPLLALHGGGRLNELAQLYLDDLVSVDGVWCIDFNLEGADKLDLDEADRGNTDKALKTVNALRQVPIHSRLITLGLLDYAEALREAGHQRLFPELHFDARKGYGKAAGSWFNERFLGKRLKIERNGRKTFHSFRHNFATALGDAEVATTTKSDLMGHSRSSALSESRYDKGRKLEVLKEAVEMLRYELPSLAPFSVPEGLQAVRDAERLKSSHAGRA